MHARGRMMGHGSSLGTRKSGLLRRDLVQPMATQGAHR